MFFLPGGIRTPEAAIVDSTGLCLVGKWCGQKGRGGRDDNIALLDYLTICDRCQRIVVVLLSVSAIMTAYERIARTSAEYADCIIIVIT